jgi:hypothetical protein
MSSHHHPKQGDGDGNCDDDSTRTTASASEWKKQSLQSLQPIVLQSLDNPNTNNDFSSEGDRWGKEVTPISFHRRSRWHPPPLEDDWHDEYDNEREFQRLERCNKQFRLRFLRWCLVLDGIMAILLTTYVYLEYYYDHIPNNIMGVVSIFTMTVLYVRLLAASMALLLFPITKIASCGLWIAGPLCSGTLSVLYFIAAISLGILCLLHRQTKWFLTILKQLGISQTMWFQRHMGLFSILVIAILFILLVLECARWHLFQAQRKWILHPGTDIDDHDLRQSLLSSLDDTRNNYDHDTTLPSSSSWADWATVWKRPRNQPTHDDDDDDNRLFENIEEWASRAEEDPLWWSRDDDDEEYAITRHLPNAERS